MTGTNHKEPVENVSRTEERSTIEFVRKQLERTKGSEPSYAVRARHRAPPSSTCVAHLWELVASNALPDYDVALDLGFVVFTRRDGKPIELPKPPAPVPELTFVDAAPQKRDILISTAAMERVTELAPRWDKYFLEKTYCAWAADKDPSHNEDARFFGWGQKLHQGPAAAVTPMTQIHNCLCRTSRSAGAAAHKVCAQGYSASPDEDPEH